MIVQNNVVKCRQINITCVISFCSVLRSSQEVDIYLTKSRAIGMEYSVAERSKALVETTFLFEGTSHFGGVGSNPTAAIFFVFVCNLDFETNSKMSVDCTRHQKITVSSTHFIQKLSDVS